MGTAGSSSNMHANDTDASSPMEGSIVSKGGFEEARRTRRATVTPTDQEVQVKSAWGNLLDGDLSAAAITALPDIPIRYADKLLMVDGLLSVAECKKLLAAAEEIGFGFTSYPKAYRGNLRLITTDPELATVLWSRLQPLVASVLELPYGASTESVVCRWRAVGLNECFRIAKYHPGDRFAPHCDAYFKRNASEMSMFTVNVYLNDGFEGGTTRFYPPCQYKNESNLPSPDLVISPRPGLAAVFRHEETFLLHDGEAVRSGFKYAPARHCFVFQEFFAAWLALRITQSACNFDGEPTFVPLEDQCSSRHRAPCCSTPFPAKASGHCRLKSTNADVKRGSAFCASMANHIACTQVPSSYGHHVSAHLIGGLQLNFITARVIFVWLHSSAVLGICKESCREAADFRQQFKENSIGDEMIRLNVAELLAVNRRLHSQTLKIPTGTSYSIYMHHQTLPIWRQLAPKSQT